MITFLNDYSAAKLFSRPFISIHSFLDSQLITDPLHFLLFPVARDDRIDSNWLEKKVQRHFQILPDNIKYVFKNDKRNKG